MRGFTLRVDHFTAVQGVFPAHAGIHPIAAPVPKLVMCLPRACGDSPYDHGYAVTCHASSPRMRGFTSSSEYVPADVMVFPAHAGIHRSRYDARCRRRCLPRACGDSPESLTAALALRASSPRMRGFTLYDELESGRDRVFPAHAGIHPHVVPEASTPPGLPRACGDSPRTGHGSRAFHESSPRMRGFT